MTKKTALQRAATKRLAYKALAFLLLVCAVFTASYIWGWMVRVTFFHK